MLANDLITEAVIPLKTSDTGADALAWMDEYRVSHLPIVNNVEFLGLISDADIFNRNSFEEPIGNHDLSLNRPFVKANQHIYDVFHLISSQELTLVPVLDEKNKYLGVITMHNLLQNYAEIAAIDDPGGIIVLELNQNDYSLSQVVQIVESNDAKVLSLFVTSHADSTKLELTLKLNKVDIFPVLQTFNRYDYIVKAWYGEEQDDELLKDRWDSLMNYLNI